MTNEDNINVFTDTLDKIATNKMLTEAVNKARTEQVFIDDVTKLPKVTYMQYQDAAKVIVTTSSSFDAARKYNNVAVLNFASSINPGGGVVHGSFAQEECLCRCSTLYRCLTDDKMMDLFYTPHREKISPLHNDDIIYTPGVVIIKSDAYNMLYKEHTVNVITCAAPNLREHQAKKYNNEKSLSVKISDDELLKLHEKRGRAILEVARYYNNENVILGAFGCGAFKNNPEVVAHAYKNILHEFNHSFKTIEFAVYCSKFESENYKVFKRIIESN